MRPILGIIALVVVAIVVCALVSHPSKGTYDSAPEKHSDTPASTPPPTTTPLASAEDRAKAFDQYKEGAIRATLTVENRGTMVLELYPKAAPKTVAHFVELCKSHFYDGIKFHRVVANFVAQAGDPKSKNLDPSEFDANQIGTNGSGTTVPLEAKLSHIVYSIGEARAQDPDSGDSQFYINLKDNAADLDGKYCVFGRVIQGQDTALKIQKGDRITSLTVP
jgi:cyclophilin family peptidyl-prolyl cis-trans isomerase